MTAALENLHLAWLSVPVVAVAFSALLIVLVAIYRKGIVKTTLHWGSFDFSLEASDAPQRRNEKERALTDQAGGPDL